MDRASVRFLDQSVASCIDICNISFWNLKPQPISQATFVFLLINLKDALQLLDKADRRINFTDDIDGGGDVTKLVADMRNSACHVGSLSKIIVDGNTLNYGVAFGRCTLMEINNIVLENPFDDDIAFFFGKMRLLLKRHIHRALSEALIHIKELAPAAGIAFSVAEIAARRGPQERPPSSG